MKLRSILPPVLVGVVALGILSGIQNSSFRESIEEQLTERAQGALSVGGLDSVGVQVTGRDAAVTAASGDDALTAADVLDDVDGIRTSVAIGPDGQVVDGASQAAAVPSEAAPAASSDATADATEVSEKPRRTPTSEERDKAQDDLVEIPNITFVTDSARLTKDGRKVVRDAAEVLEEHPEVEVRIEGHTDSRNSEAHNLRLSERRAEQVVDELVELGVEQDRLTFKGFGESDPLVVPKTFADLEKNRRVEFAVQN